MEVLDMERPPVPLCAPPHVGHYSGPEGGEPRPTALPLMRYIFSLEGAEQEASGHNDVQQGGGAENQADEGGGGSSEHNNSLPGLLETSGYSDTI